MQILAIRMEGARRAAVKLTAAVFTFAAAFVVLMGTAHAQDVKVTNTGIDEPTPVKYSNMFEVYGGINLMEFTAGNLPKRATLGGAEVLGTYWATHRLGIGVDARGEAGTTPATPTLTYFPLVQQYMLMGGAQWRGPRNQQFALNYHGYAGEVYGNFKSSLHGADPSTYGLFPNQYAPIAAGGISLDWNRGPHLAIRLSPDCYFTHYSSPTAGAEWEETFGLGLGLIYRFHDRY
jgi:hypothetical protein